MATNQCRQPFHIQKVLCPIQSSLQPKSVYDLLNGELIQEHVWRHAQRERERHAESIISDGSA